MLRGSNVRNSPIALTTAVLLAIGAAVMVSPADARSAGTETTASAETGYGSTVNNPPGSPNNSNSGSGANGASASGDSGSNAATPSSAELDAQLAAARAQLEQAAHEVAEISARMSRPLMNDIMQFDLERPPRSVIGVQLDTKSGKEGARIQEVSPGGPAAEAGLHVGDVIVAVNGADVKGDDPARQVLHRMRNVDPDSKVKVTIVRDGKPHEFVVTARPGAGYYMGMHEHDRGPRLPRPPQPPNVPGLPFDGFEFAPSMMIRGPLGEMQLVTLSPQLGRYFGTDKGVLVVRAPKDEDFKLEDGDVILAIDGREPSSGSHAIRILGSYQPGEKVSMKVMRQHKTLNVETTLPESRGFGPRPPQSDRKVRLEHRETTPTT
jgi:membrane-associated protease RseP (regulator of RpoE activity)